MSALTEKILDQIETMPNRAVNANLLNAMFKGAYFVIDGVGYTCMWKTKKTIRLADAKGNNYTWTRIGRSVYGRNEKSNNLAKVFTDLIAIDIANRDDIWHKPNKLTMLLIVQLEILTLIKNRKIEEMVKKSLIETPTAVFHPMTEFPVKQDGEDHSLDVLIYGESDDKEGEYTFSELGFYDYTTKQWSHFGDFQLDMVCWCYVPNATDWVKENNPKVLTQETTHKPHRPDRLIIKN